MKNPATPTNRSLREWIRKATSDCDSILEFGSGMGERLSDTKCKLKLGIEIHRPYAEEAVVRHPGAIYLNCPAQLAATFALENSVDCVLLSDFLEHISKADGLKIINNAKRIARVRVVVFGPCGEFPNPEGPALEKWTQGMGGHYYMFHRSVWTPDDLVDFDTVELPNHYLDHNGKRRTALFAIWEP